VIDHSTKSFQFQIGSTKLLFALNFTIAKNFDVHWEILTKEKKLFNWNACINKWIKSYKKFFSVDGLLAHALYLYVEMVESSPKTFSPKLDPEVALNCYKETWGETKCDPQAILTSSQFVEKQMEIKNKLDGDFTNPFKWTLHIDTDKNSQLFADILAHSKKFHNKDTKIKVEVYFDSAFPKSRPILRIVKPRLVYGTANIKSDGTIHIKDWNPKIPISSLITHMMDQFSTARVDMRINSSYDVFHHFQNSDLPTKNEFSQEFFAFSGDFASKCFVNHFSHRLERANNVCYPKSLNKIFPPQNIKKSDPPTFEITHNGQLNGYCGLLEATAPKNCVILPSWMMQDMMLNEGTKIQLRCVDLPLSELVTFKPLSKKFYKVQNVDTALTEALRPYTTLHKGQVIPLSDSKTTIYLEVASCKPSNAVRIQVARNQFLDLKLDFAPAIDFCQETFNESVLSPIKRTSPTKKSTTFTTTPEPVKETEIEGIPCVNCRKTIPEKTMDLHLTHCRRNYFTCHKCDQVVKVSDKTHHEETEHCMKACPICKESMESWKLKIHSSECRMLPCRFCCAEFDPKSVKEHESKCLMIQEQCHDCGQLFLRKYLISHAKVCDQEHIMFHDRFHDRGLEDMGRWNPYRNKDVEEEEESEEDVLQKVLKDSMKDTVLDTVKDGEIKTKIKKSDGIQPIPIGQLTCCYCQTSGMTKESLMNHLLDLHPEDPDHLIETLSFL
jgi:hypothetical protein